MATEEMKKHPIQLIDIRVNDITFKRMNDSVGEINVTSRVAFGKAVYSPDVEIIKCGVKAECQGKHDNEIEFILTVEIIGIFSIEKATFSIDMVPAWQEKNAPYILMPFLREQVYSLSLRTGIPQIIIPMAIVPTTRSTTEAVNSGT